MAQTLLLIGLLVLFIVLSLVIGFDVVRLVVNAVILYPLLLRSVAEIKKNREPYFIVGSLVSFVLLLILPLSSKILWSVTIFALLTYVLAQLARFLRKYFS